MLVRANVTIGQGVGSIANYLNFSRYYRNFDSSLQPTLTFHSVFI